MNIADELQKLADLRRDGSLSDAEFADAKRRLLAQERQEGAGGPEVLKVEKVPVPKPGSGQVLIRVYAAALNPADYGQLGRPPPAGTRQIAGLDISGVIVAVAGGAVLV